MITPSKANNELDNHMNNFQEMIYTNNEKTLKATDELLLNLWGNLCEKHTKKLSVEAIRNLMKVNVKTKLIGISSNVANELTDPFYICSDGAALFPNEFQPWERYDLSLCVREKDGTFTTTFDGEVMKNKMHTSLANLYAIENNKRAMMEV